MDNRTIYVTENDYKKLREVIREARNGEYRNSAYVQNLEGEIERAEIVPGQQIPADVITMHSRVLLTDVAEGEPIELTLTYPDESSQTPDGVSILAPIGTAIIGYRVGDVIEWDTPNGRTTLRVDKILYQPESAGKYD